MENQIIVPRIITRGFVLAHPEWNFVHGHDVQQKGFFGHGSIFNEQNTFPVPTMYKFCASGARYFTDDDSEVQSILIQALQRIPHDKPIIVLRKIGEGCSRMKELSPRNFEWLRRNLQQINYGNIKWDYTM